MFCTLSFIGSASFKIARTMEIPNLLSSSCRSPPISDQPACPRSGRVTSRNRSWFVQDCYYLLLWRDRRIGNSLDLRPARKTGGSIRSCLCSFVSPCCQYNPTSCFNCEAVFETDWTGFHSLARGRLWYLSSLRSGRAGSASGKQL